MPKPCEGCQPSQGSDCQVAGRSKKTGAKRNNRPVTRPHSHNLTSQKTREANNRKTLRPKRTLREKKEFAAAAAMMQECTCGMNTPWPGAFRSPALSGSIRTCRDGGELYGTNKTCSNLAKAVSLRKVLTATSPTSQKNRRKTKQQARNPPP